MLEKITPGVATLLVTIALAVSPASGAPTITTIEPAGGPSGAAITITGSGFGSALADPTISIDEVNGTGQAGLPASADGEIGAGCLGTMLIDDAICG